MAPKIKPVKNKLRPGIIVEITQNIGCIPRGVYLFEAKESGFLHFGIYETAVFGISNRCQQFVRKVKHDEHKPLTSPADFTRRYYALLAFVADSGPGADLPPPTYCAVDPRALKYLSDGFIREERLN